MGLTVVPMAERHLPFLAEIEKACFSAPWSETALQEELGNPIAVFLVAQSEKGDVLGYAGMHVAVDEGYFDNVAVSPESRRQGVGDALISAMVKQGQKRNLSRLTLEVRVSNAPARALYEKHGFILDGIRPGFYTAPKEDAAILSLYLE